MSSRELALGNREHLPPHEGRRQLVDQYIGSWSDGDTDDALEIAKQIKRKRPLADTVCMLATAAHQEVDNIPHAIAQYAGQLGAEPFTVIVGLNFPLSESQNSAVALSLDAVEKAKRQYPDVDIRSSLTAYKEPKIGKIRRDIWNGVTLLAHVDGVLGRGNHEVLGLDHGIDLQYLPPTYLQTVQRHYNRLIPTLTRWNSPASSTRMWHAASPEHPNISRALVWNEWLFQMRSGYYEASVVLPMSFYAMQGGHDGDRTWRETIELVGRNNQSWPKYIQLGRAALTSPRRFIEKLPTMGYEVWDSATEISANDTYRETTSGADIDEKMLVDLVVNHAEYLDHIAQWIIQDTYKKLAPGSRQGEILSATDPVLQKRVSQRIQHLGASAFTILADHIDLPSEAQAIAKTLEPNFIKDEIDEMLVASEKAARDTREALELADEIKRSGRAMRIYSMP